MCLTDPTRTMSDALTAADFDAAAAVWMANKVRRGPMIYYRCQQIQGNGKQCSRAGTDVSSHGALCTQHVRYYKGQDMAPWSGIATKK